MMENVLILKGVGGFYTVLRQGGEIAVCRPRGRFRKDGVTPLPGDRAAADLPPDGQEGYLLELRPRKNVLTRPAVVNVDQLVVVLSLSRPKPDLLLCDKLLLQAEAWGIAPVLALNKLDEADAGALAALEQEYAAAGYPLLPLSAARGDGMEALRRALAGKVSCLAGQSATGKTSLLNTLVPELALPVGGLAKTQRGRHTTRHTQLCPLPWGGTVADTPGFSLLEPGTMEPEQLSALYPEMRQATEECRFAGCLHASEPDCAVKALLAEGKLSQGRYERYLELLEVLKEFRRRQYD